MSSPNRYLPPEERRKAATVDRIVDVILDWGVDDYAEALLELYGRWEVLGQTSYLWLTPIASAFYGQEGLDVAELMGLTPREGSALVLKRLKEIKAEREKEKLYKQEKETVPFWFRIKSWLSRLLHRQKT